MLLAAVLLVAFAIVASTDSLYFHTYRFRLHTRRASRFEHYLHTANIVLFVPQCWLMFCVRPSGAWLWATAFLVLATFGVEITDVLCERGSREDLGGLLPIEYAMHFLMAALRAFFTGVFFAGYQLADFLAAPSLGPSPVAAVGWMMVVPGTAIALFHVWLCRTPLEPLSVAREPGAALSADV